MAVLSFQRLSSVCVCVCVCRRRGEGGEGVTEAPNRALVSSRLAHKVAPSAESALTSTSVVVPVHRKERVVAESQQTPPAAYHQERAGSTCSEQTVNCTEVTQTC